MMSENKPAKTDLNNLNAGGFIKERGKDLFTVRILVPCGRMSVSRLKKIAEVADKLLGLKQTDAGHNILNIEKHDE